MLPICSFYLLISHLKQFISWHFIRFSSWRWGWAIIRPRQAWKDNHCLAFWSHGVFFPNDKATDCVPVVGAFAFLALQWILLEGHRQEMGTEADEGSDTSGSFIWNSNQAAYHASTQHYQPAPCWEIYLRTVMLSAKQLSIRTHRWFILRRNRLIFHFLVTERCQTMSPVYCATDVFNHRELKEEEEERITLHEACIDAVSVKYHKPFLELLQRSHKTITTTEGNMVI